MFNTVTDRQNFIYDSLEQYAMWVPKNLDKIRSNARISETMLPIEQWTQMFGLDLFCEEFKYRAKPFQLKSSKPTVEYYRETLSREVGCRKERLMKSVFAQQFPGIVNKKKQKVTRSKKTRTTVQVKPMSVFEVAQSSDDLISNSLNTSYQESVNYVEEAIKILKSSGATKIVIEL